MTGLVQHQFTARFRVADRVAEPSRELTKLTQGVYQKVSGSRQLGLHLDVANHRSRSFMNLVRGIHRLQLELLALP